MNIAIDILLKMNLIQCYQTKKFLLLSLIAQNFYNTNQMSTPKHEKSGY